MKVQTVSVAREDSDIRLDRWFRRYYPELSHGRLEKLLRTGQVRVDGRRGKAGQRLSEGQSVRIPPLGDTRRGSGGDCVPKVRPEDFAMIRDCVLYIDDAVIVLNKPAGLATQGGTNTLRHVDGMLDALSFNRQDRPRLVHRLDKDTSGVLVLGRTAGAAAELAKSFSTRETHKVYWALVKGVPDPPVGTIDAALAKQGGGGGREKVVVDPEEGQNAVTEYRVVETAGDRVAWLCLKPRTGRTHQLRVHCLMLGTPILGDGKYAGAEAHLGADVLTKKLHLHARAIAIPHPDGGMIRVVAPVSAHIAESFSFFGFDQSLEADPFLS